MSAHLIFTVRNGNALDYTPKEIVFQSADNTHNNATSFATVQSWDITSNTLSVTTIVGDFTDNVLVIGVTSNARYYLTSYDPLKDSVRNEVYDNSYIDNQANNIIDFAETNPFGRI